MRDQLVISQPFDLDLTLCCGQVFRWDHIGQWWYGVINGYPVKVRQLGSRLEFENVNSEAVSNYFAFDQDLTEVYGEIAKDSFIKKAVKSLRGLRIIRQEPWECLISYICATYKNIPAIKQMLHSLSQTFGREMTLDENIGFAFPNPEKLARASMKQLETCGLGYRARYVHETAKMISDGTFILDKLESAPYVQAKKEILSLPGVGQKVADCVLLFSLGKTEAFPIDIWVKRALVRHYRTRLKSDLVDRLTARRYLSNSDYDRLSEFGRAYFGNYAGYAQEYLYYFERALRPCHTV